MADALASDVVLVGITRYNVSMIHIGTSGFNYDDWIGRFYPSGMAKSKMLEYYAERFEAVEINSTYYGIPAPATFQSMAKRTPRDFRFCVKANKEMTHSDNPSAEVFGSFLSALEPLEEAGKLGCVLAQYPWGFVADDANRARLGQFRDRVGDLPVVVEFRNSGWTGEHTQAFLRELGFGYCCVDEPHLKGLMPREALATSDIGYVRFHGRNAAKWWEHDEAHERYDYLYTPEELREWAPKVEAIAAQTKDTYLFFNNHYRGKSADNARTFAGMLALQLPMADLFGGDV